MIDVITLVKEKNIINEYGEKEKVRSSREILGIVKSIGQKEFYEGMAHGLNLEKRFEITDYLDYEDEKLAIFENQEYKVIRAYRTITNTLELTLERSL